MQVSFMPYQRAYRFAFPLPISLFLATVRLSSFFFSLPPRRLRIPRSLITTLGSLGGHLNLISSRISFRVFLDGLFCSGEAPL